MLRQVRRVVQAASLVGFLALLTLTRYGGSDQIPYPVRFYLDIDPLILIGMLLSSGAAPVAFLSSLAVLLLSLLVGRAFCGWLCPLGALNQLAGRWRRRPGARQRAVHGWSAGQRIKYGVLAALLPASALGLSWVGLLDPISLTIRSFALALAPAAELGVRSFFNALYRTELGAIRAVSEPVYDLLKQTVLSFEQPCFRQAELIGLVAVAVLALNLVRPRFFCRFVCPLGALLGIVARASLIELRSASDCNRCGKCELRCPGGAEPAEAGSGRWRPSECYVCGNCTAECEPGLKLAIATPARWRLLEAFRGLFHAGTAVKATTAGGANGSTGVVTSIDIASSTGDAASTGAAGIDIGRRTLAAASTGAAGIDIGRRTLLAGAAAGLVAAPLVKIPLLKNLPNPALIRPPGSLPEPDFLARCVRCGECMKVCLTGGLQPALFEAGLEGLWTPMLIPRLGYCEYNCTLCGQVCPTGAIRRLKADRKRRVSIGTAFIDPARCLPLAFGLECLVCEEHCPTSPKAISLAEHHSFGPNPVRRPVIDPSRCIGCGICETRCPVKDLPAVRVSSIGETRDADNRPWL